MVDIAIAECERSFPAFQPKETEPPAAAVSGSWAERCGQGEAGR